MMNKIFNLIQNKTPLKSTLKERCDDDGILIVLADNLEIFYFNDVAASIFSFMDGKTTIIEIFHKIQEIYEVPDTELANDLVKITRDFQWNGLIKI